MKKNPYLIAHITESLTAAYPVYHVEPELVKWARLHAQFYLERYREGFDKHWSHNEERSTYVGLVGQKCFDVLLQQLEVSAIHNDPVIDWRGKKTYDFKVHGLGTVEVKCFDYYCEMLLVKLSEWHRSDYLVAYKFEDKEPTEVTMSGYLTGKEVESLPIAKQGEKKFSKLAECYYCELTKLHRGKDFIIMLQDLAV